MRLLASTPARSARGSAPASTGSPPDKLPSNLSAHDLPHQTAAQAILTNKLQRGTLVRKTLRDRSGRIWLATDHGVFLLRPGVPPQQFARSAGLSNDQVLDIPEDQEGNIWVATQNGLNRLRPDKFVTFDDLSIRHNAAIADLAPANDGSLWIGSRSGLDRLSGVTHHRFATGQAVTALETGDDGGAIYLSGGRLRSTSGSVAHTLPNSSLAPASLLARSRSGPLWRYSRDAGLCRLNLTNRGANKRPPAA